MVRRPSLVRRRPSVVVVNKLKHLLLQNRLLDQSQIYVESPWVGGTKVCSQHLGHMTKMAATPIYGKNPSKIFSRTGRPIFTKLGIFEINEFHCHLKVGKCRQLIDFMKYVSIEEQGHFLTLAQCHEHSSNNCAVLNHRGQSNFTLCHTPIC